MILFVAGGSASGKSAYAQEQAAALQMQDLPGEKPLIYAATMSDQSPESLARILRHQEQRQGLAHETRECFSLKALEALITEASGRTVLFDCLSGFVADVLFADARGEQAVLRIPRLLEKLGASCRHLVIVSDLVFSDGRRYDVSTENYIKHLGICCRAAAAAADRAVEVVCGIPVTIKGITE